MNPNVPSIEQLKELALPVPVSYAPQTWGWWALLTLLVLSLLLVSARRYWQWRRDRYRREALARLAELQQRSNDLNALRELPELLKRVALSMPAPHAPCRSCRRLRSFTAEDQKIAAFGSSYTSINSPSRRSDCQIDSAIRQGDVEFQNRATALAFQCNMYVVVADVDVLADHVDQFLLQGWQVIRRAALAALMRHDDL